MTPMLMCGWEADGGKGREHQIRYPSSHTGMLPLVDSLRSGAVPEENLWLGTVQGECLYEEDKSMPPEDFKQIDAAVHRCESYIRAQ
jgi:hypothetical protein